MPSRFIRLGLKDVTAKKCFTDEFLENTLAWHLEKAAHAHLLETLMLALSVFCFSFLFCGLFFFLPLFDFVTGSVLAFPKG